MLKTEKEIKTINGNSIQLKTFTGVQNAKKVLFMGVTHGDEPQGKYLINRYIENLQKKRPNIIKNTLMFIPCVNPDGMTAETRTNANGVDINRNFPTSNWVKTEKNEFFGGEAPSSEIETQFLQDVINKYTPDVIVSFHAPFKVVNFDGPAKKIAQKISEIIKYPLQENIGYPTPGSFGTFCGIEKGIPTITLELEEALPDDELWIKCKPIFELFEKDTNI